MPNSVSVGDKILVPEYGGTKVVFEDQVSFVDCAMYKRSLEAIGLEGVL